MICKICKVVTESHYHSMCGDCLSAISRSVDTGSSVDKALAQRMPKSELTFNAYAEDVLALECGYSGLKVNGPLLVQKLHRVINAGRGAEHVKKHTYYGKPLGEVPLEYNRYKDGVDFDRRLNDPQALRLLHSVLGLASEAGELAEALMEYFNGGELDFDNLREEFGDSAWYLALGCDELCDSPDEILRENSRKLHTRYPDGFSKSKALNRDLSAELNSRKMGNNS